MYEQAKKAIWEAVDPHTGKRRIDQAFPPELRKRTDNSSMTIEFVNGAIWKVVGSDNPDSLVGASPAGIVFSEWALSNPSAWGYLAPILDENGGWAMFITTPRGRNHVKTLLDGRSKDPTWFTEVLSVRETGYPLERVEKQREEYKDLFGDEAADALIEQEYFCSFEAAILGAYYGKELAAAEREGRIRDLEYDPHFPVHTAWDLGVGDANAIWWFQMAGSELHVLDYYEAHGYAMQHYAEVVKSKPWKRGNDYVPHDAKMREYTQAGPDGKARQRVEVMFESGLKPKLVPMHTLMDGISAARQTLPRCYFNAKACEKGLNHLRQYRAEWDEDKRVFKDVPLHDWTSHGADAFRYLALAWREEAAAKPPEPKKPENLVYQIIDGKLRANMSIWDIVEAKRKKRERA